MFIVAKAKPGQFNIAQTLNKGCAKPRAEILQEREASKMERYRYMREDMPRLSYWFKDIYKDIERFLPQIKIVASSNVVSAFNLLAEKFSEIIKTKGGMLLDSPLPVFLKNPDKEGAIGTFAGGLQNALQLYLALAKVAVQKLEKLLPRSNGQFDSTLKKVLDNNQHIASQFSKIHVAVLKLIESVNGIIPNQENPYSLDEANFGIYSRKNRDDLYLLPTQEHLDEVKTLSDNPKTEIKTLVHHKVHGPKVVISKFGELNHGNRLGCPIFGARRFDLDDNSEVDLEDEFFNNLNKIIQDILFLQKSPGGLFVVGE